MKKSILYILIFVSLSYILNSQNIHFQLKTKLEGFMFKPDSLDIFFYSTGETVRLKAKDSFNLNTLDVLNDNSNNNNLTLKSNIVGNSISFDLNSESDCKATLNIYDISGNSVLTQEIILSSGINSKEIELPNINSGIYFLKITNGNQQYSAKFIKSDKTIGGINNPPIKLVSNIQSSEVIKVTAYLKTFIPQTFDNITIANDTNLVLVMSNRTLGKVKSIYLNTQINPIVVGKHISTHQNGSTNYDIIDSFGIINYSNTINIKEYIKESVFDSSASNNLSIKIIQTKLLFVSYSEPYYFYMNFDFDKMEMDNFDIQEAFGIKTGTDAWNYTTSFEMIAWKTIQNIEFSFDNKNMIILKFNGIDRFKNSIFKWAKVDYIYTNYASFPWETDTYGFVVKKDSNCNFSMTIEFE